MANNDGIFPFAKECVRIAFEIVNIFSSFLILDNLFLCSTCEISFFNANDRHCRFTYGISNESSADN